MLRPERSSDQYTGKALSEAFRGSGLWPVQLQPCDLEPPWEPFDARSVNHWDCYLHGWEAPWEGSWLKKAFCPPETTLRRETPITLPRSPHAIGRDLVAIVIEQFAEDKTTIPKADQFLRSLPNLRHPISFELVGFGPQPNCDMDYIQQISIDQSQGIPREMELPILSWSEPFAVAQFVAHQADARRIERQLLAHYPCPSGKRAKSFLRGLEVDGLGVAGSQAAE